MPISGNSKLGLGDMLDEVIKHFKPGTAEEEEDERPHVAIVGKPNVGKSSLINKLTGENRVIVSNIAGTTRDAIDTPFVKDGQKYRVVDTAGMRKKGKVYENIEKYSISVLPFFLWQEPLHPVPEPHDQIPQGIEAMVVLFYRYFSALI